MNKNSLKKIRESLMMGKAEIARRANVSPNTITRIENGMSCRMQTQRKIIMALGYKILDKSKVFNDDMASNIKDNGSRRSNTGRRQFNYDWHIPEKRFGKERRSGLDRRRKPRLLNL